MLRIGGCSCIATYTYILLIFFLRVLIMTYIYTLVLITSLKSQFHHDLDFKVIGDTNQFYSAEKCEQFGSIIANKLKSKNNDLEVEILCIKY